jgi:hypothetical protein
MATPDGNFVFVNAPAAHRTARIPPSEWEKHRVQITNQFLACKKLADVVTVMQLEHGFHAT